MLGFMERIGSVDMAWRFWYGLMQQGGGRWVVALRKVEFFFFVTAVERWWLGFGKEGFGR